MSRIFECNPEGPDDICEDLAVTMYYQSSSFLEFDTFGKMIFTNTEDLYVFHCLWEESKFQFWFSTEVCGESVAEESNEMTYSTLDEAIRAAAIHAAERLQNEINDPDIQKAMQDDGFDETFIPQWREGIAALESLAGNWKQHFTGTPWQVVQDDEG